MSSFTNEIIFYIQKRSVSNKESTCKFSGKWKFLFALGHIKLVYKNDAEYKTPMELMLATRGNNLSSSV